MRIWAVSILFIGGLFGANSIPKQAKQKASERNFAEASRLYTSAIETYPGQRASLEFNIGQCWMYQDSMGQATSYFSRAAENKLNNDVASFAWNNLGVVWASEKQPPMPQPTDPTQGAQAQGSDPLQAEIDKLSRSLEAFKSSLRKNPENEYARFNYELLKRKQEQLQQQQQQQQQNQQQDQQQDQQQQEQQKEEKDDKQQNRPQQQQKSNRNTEGKGNEAPAEEISVEQAKQLLEAMKDNEKRFIQQLEKSKKRRENRQDGPDW